MNLDRQRRLLREILLTNDVLLVVSISSAGVCALLAVCWFYLA
jgi:hypothetical protein